MNFQFKKISIVAALFFAGNNLSSANPTGLTVGSGSASAVLSGSQLNITTSPVAFLNWSSFNIAAGETSRFLQPAVNSVGINQIGGASPSQIFGNLTANGTVILANANGFYFGPNSMVSVGGSFIATTAPLTPDFGAGSAWTFTGMPPLASIVNYGQVKVGAGKSLYLIAEQIENHGTLDAPGGDLGLLAGQKVMLNERADGRGFSSNVLLPTGSVDNFGQITADAGTIALQAQVVNQNGLIQADSVQNVNGVVELVASDSLNLGASSVISTAGGKMSLNAPTINQDGTLQANAIQNNSGTIDLNAAAAVNLGANSVISANGDTAGTSAGGLVNIQSSAVYLDQSGSVINVGGGTLGGNAGQVTISAPQMSLVETIMNGHAAPGYADARLNLDTANITVNGDGSAVAGQLALNANSLAAGFSQVNLQATGNLEVSSLWHVIPKSGQLDTVSLLAGGTLTVDAGAGIQVDGGKLMLNANTVNQNGRLQANAIDNANGVIEINAGGTLALGASSQIVANGDSTYASGSAGGFVVLDAGIHTFTDAAGSTISVSGAKGGPDGVVEIFGNNLLDITSIHSTIGNNFATLINPYDITLSLKPTATSVATVNKVSVLDVNFNVNDLAGYSQIDMRRLGYSQIDLHALDNIELQTAWILTDPGVPTTLQLQAGNNLKLDDNTSLVAGYDWNLKLVAGAGFVTTLSQPVPTSGSDEIFLDGSSYLQTQDGDINLFTSGSVQVGNPNYTTPGTGSYINTVGGGNIYATALYGDINAGKNYTGYVIGNNGLSLGGNVGGISTLAGGNVTLDAGHDVISVPQTRTTSATTPGASGAYDGGDVTVIAGHQITGNFLVSNGTGKLEAGVAVDQNHQVTVNNPTADIGTPQQGVNLSLISGNWEVYAARNLYLTEVNNPNGTFNAASIRIPTGTFGGNIDSSGKITLPTPKSGNLFNYAPNAGGAFWAGNAMTLGNGTIFRYRGESDNIPIFPPILSLMAGVGGITLDSSLILYPSSQGSLNVDDGGNFTGVVNSSTTAITSITMSDSGLPGFATFASGHAQTPLHSTDPNPVVFDVAGSIANFSLTVPTFAEITVGGAQPFTEPNGQNVFGTYNFNFSGQNLAASGAGSLTSINVAGDIIYQGLVTSISLNNYNAAALPAAMFDASISTDPSVTQYLAYDPATGLLSYRGQMNSLALAFLQNPTVLVNGQTQTIPLTSAQKSALAALYAQSQGVVASGSGISLNGPGQFDITAQNMDLGTSAGIQVNQFFLPELSKLAKNGASLDISLSGNLEMTTTAIGNSGWQGGIQIDLGGTLDLGLQSLFGAANNVARGIYTTSDGNISVTAGGDVDVDGSRIAAYDGGNVSVTSLHGDVNAGSGGNGDVEVETELQLDAAGMVTPLATAINIPGSGIMAITDGGSSISVGNITVAALQGSINADLGGIEQIPFNHLISPDSFIALDAGKDISAGNSGVIGSNIRITAGGDVSGVFVGTGAVNISAGQNFSGTIVGSGFVNVSAGGSVTGTIVGGDSVSVSGSDITADLISGSVSTVGDASGASVGIPQANAARQDNQVADNADSVVSKNDGETDDDAKKKKKPAILAQKVSRVTVILPSKKLSEKTAANNPL